MNNLNWTITTSKGWRLQRILYIQSYLWEKCLPSFNELLGCWAEQNRWNFLLTEADQNHRVEKNISKSKQLAKGMTGSRCPFPYQIPVSAESLLALSFMGWATKLYFHQSIKLFLLIATKEVGSCVCFYLMNLHLPHFQLRCGKISCSAESHRFLSQSVL